MRTVTATLLVASSLLSSAAVAAAMACSPPPLPAQPLQLELLIDGVPQRQWPARGKTYVEAQRGREYSLRLRNLTGERVAVALSVDGLGTIDAKTTSMQDAAKWILAPWQSIVIDGWQTSAQSARRFYFTTEQESYGAWLGRTDNLGVITAALFRERAARRCDELDLGLRGDSPRAGASQAAPPAAAPERQREQKSDSRASRDEYAATGIGREVDHGVVRVDFEEESQPAAVVSLRYEYRPALIALGVIPRSRPHALSRRESARGFEAMEFAPDPYRP